MQINKTGIDRKYHKLLIKGKMDKADKLRMSEIPDKLYKYVALETNKDKEIFETLSNSSIWFNCINSFNDPFEHKGMILDKNELATRGLNAEMIKQCEGILSMDSIEISCFTSCGYDNLPMWAYYANNSKGYCIEYEVIKRDAVYKVMYKPKREDVTEVLCGILRYAPSAQDGSVEAKRYADSLIKILMQNAYIKDLSWKHENEYRIAMPIRKDAGERIHTNEVGLRIRSIIAGINCSEKNIIKLADISNKLGYVDFYRLVQNDEDYSIGRVRI